MNILIIGTGLIGGSLALSLRGFQTTIIGYDANPEHMQQALDLGLTDQVMPLDQALPVADLVILAIPVNQARELLPSVLDQISPEAVVTDMGSTKQGICRKVRQHSRRAQYVAAHPIAGTEHSGPRAAQSGLFKNKVAIICERELSSEKAVQLVERLFFLLEMKIIYMQADEHDRHIAYVSHLSHISSFTLGLTVLEIEKNESTIFDMAGSGFASTVRLAKSSPDMWNPIFMQNREHLLVALDAYIGQLSRFRALIEARDYDTLYKLMKEANLIRRVLDGPDK